MKYVKSISLFFIYPACCFVLGIMCGRIANETGKELAAVESEPSADIEEFISEPEEDKSVLQGQSVMNHGALRESQAPEMTSADSGYYIAITNGYVTIYQEDRETVFLNTEILGTDLPDDVLNDLNEWIYMKDEGMLYDFLENYTS